MVETSVPKSEVEAVSHIGNLMLNRIIEGEREYGKNYKHIDMFSQAEEELADLFNYMVMQYVKIREKLDIDKRAKELREVWLRKCKKSHCPILDLMWGAPEPTWLSCPDEKAALTMHDIMAHKKKILDTGARPSHIFVNEKDYEDGKFSGKTIAGLQIVPSDIVGRNEAVIVDMNNPVRGKS